MTISNIKEAKMKIFNDTKTNKRKKKSAIFTTDV